MFGRLRAIFKHRLSPEETRIATQKEELEKVYADIKEFRDKIIPHLECRYAFDSFTGEMVNQGPDGIDPDRLPGFIEIYRWDTSKKMTQESYR